MKKSYKSLETLLTVCSECRKDEKILIVTDPTSLEVALAMYNQAADYPNKSMIMMDERTMHGQEPTALVAAAMLEADVIFRATKFSLSHSKARENANARGARDLNMADYDMRMLEKGGLYVDYIEAGKGVDKVTAHMKGDTIRITAPNGTDYTAKITGQKASAQYGRSIKKGTTSSPPDMECAIGALDGTSNGIVYIDGSIPHPRLGVITDKQPIKLIIKDGSVVEISGGPQAKELKKFLDEQNDPDVFVVGEIGIGLNPACTLTGKMLEDEGCYGTVHLGLGENAGLGGRVDMPFHLDLIFKAPTVAVDGVVVMRAGEIAV